jgi:hypothetical protein
MSPNIVVSKRLVRKLRSQPMLTCACTGAAAESRSLIGVSWTLWFVIGRSVAPLRRFWFPLPRYFGIGVTAASLVEARALAERARREYWLDAPPLAEVIEDIDVSTLDAGHVIPNMRPPLWPGIWYPMM